MHGYKLPVHLLLLALTLVLPHGFSIAHVATVTGARELAFSPSGDLYVGTHGGTIYVLPHADSNKPGTPSPYAIFDDSPAAGVAYADGALYVATQHAIWRVRGKQQTKLASVRTGSPPAGSDGDVHTTSSVAVWNGTVYASVGSSCNECVESDPTRATVGKIAGSRYVPIAKRIRNAIALAIDPQSGAIWASDAGQDELPVGHPYEFFDDVSAQRQPADYGWPVCYENHQHKPGTQADCSHVALPLVVFPAYETPIGAVFYPVHQQGRYAFPARYAGGAFVTLHGSWHGPAQGLSGYRPPLVAFVPMHGDMPARHVDWKNPSTQWSTFVGGYQEGASISRIGRPTGIAVSPQGDLFIADDQTGAIYRVRWVGR